MLSILGFSMIAVFMYLIMSKRLSALVAIMLVPIIFGVIGGFFTELGPMMQEGVEGIASTAIMILFAILYFGIMIDSGLFDPLISKILKIVKRRSFKNSCRNRYSLNDRRIRWGRDNYLHHYCLSAFTPL